MTYRFWLVFGLIHLFPSSVISPVAAGETGRLKCWLNSNPMFLDEVHREIKRAETDVDEWRAFERLTDHPIVEGTCLSDSDICVDYTMDIKTRRQPFRFNVKGCGPFNVHKTECARY